MRRQAADAGGDSADDNLGDTEFGEVGGEVGVVEAPQVYLVTVLSPGCWFSWGSRSAQPSGSSWPPPCSVRPDGPP